LCRRGCLGDGDVLIKEATGDEYEPVGEIRIVNRASGHAQQDLGIQAQHDELSAETRRILAVLQAL
jgi:hypothetical protein